MIVNPPEQHARVWIRTAREHHWLTTVLRNAGFDLSLEADLDKAAVFAPHVVIVDETNIDLCTVEALPGCPAYLALAETDDHVDALLKGGAHDYITPTTAPAAIINRVKAQLCERILESSVMPQTQMLGGMSDALLAIDNDFRVLYWNDGAERLYGKSAQEMVGSPLTNAYTFHWMQPCDEEAARSALEQDGMWHGENIHHTHDNRWLTVEIHVSQLKRSGGLPYGMLVVIQDITERKRVEAAEREQRLLAEALRDTAAALTRTLDPQSVMNLILENVGRVVPHQTANIMTIEGGIVRVAVSRGYSPEATAQLNITSFPLSFGTFQHMMQTGESLLIEDTAQDDRWHSMEMLPWVRCYVATPIRAYDHVIGFLNLDSPTPNAFSSADAERLRAFADQAAIAIENAQLYDAIYRDASEMRALHRATAFLFTTNLFTSENVREVAEQIAHTVINEFGKVDCGVILLDETRTKLVRWARAGEYKMHAHVELLVNGPGLVPEAIRTGSTIYAPNAAEHPQYVASDSRTRSELVVPLRTMKGIVGVLDLQSSEPNAFDTHDQRVIQAFAERAAAAIENMKLYSEIQQRVNERTAELNRVKERAEAILNHSSDAILLLREDGRIQQTNNAFNQMFGFQPDEAFGRTFETIAGPYYAEVLHKALQEVVHENRSVRVEITATYRDNAAIDADVVMSPIITQGQVTSVVCSLRDISQRKRLEFELRDALAKERELNELKSRFVSRASHEFRTPLAMIATSSDLLKNYGHRMTEEQRVEKLNRVQAEIKNMTLLLDDLLTISKAEEVGRIEFQPKPMDLGALCRELVEEVSAGIGMNHVLEFLPSGDCSRVYVDRKLIRRAVLNLLSNAVKYSDGGSKIQLSLACDPVQTVIVVQDSGIGIPEEDQKSLFEAFHRGHNVEHITGTGLGLAIVKQSVELHNGEVSFNSQVGVGSAFTLIIPNLAIEEELA
jgi:PAS domain S-box-containing protein